MAILKINGYELVAVKGTYQIYKDDFCVECLRGNFSKIKQYFKNIAKNNNSRQSRNQNKYFEFK